MNLLKNPNFDEGHYHQDGIAEIVVPKDWYLYWIDKEIFKGAAAVAYRPESVVWNIKDAPAHEKTLFFLSGDYCWKIFKASAPVYYAATQVVSGLTPGATYRFNAKVFPDIVTGHAGGKKIRPTDIRNCSERINLRKSYTCQNHERHKQHIKVVQVGTTTNLDTDDQSARQKSEYRCNIHQILHPSGFPLAGAV